MFKRKKAGSATGDADSGEESSLVDSAKNAPAAATGPWDSADDIPRSEAPRVDLGAIRVPVPKDLELRLEVDPQGNVGAATLADDHSTLQLNAFAAPRRAGLWDDVRAEIAQALTEQGVSAAEVDGTLGRELVARLPTGDAKGTTTPARFVGSDGPRWFLRGLFTGPAATNPEQAKPFEDLFRDIVVVRGTEAMAPRDPLGLRIPTDTPKHGDEDDDEDDSGTAYGDLDPFERGPEITEIH